MSTERQTETTQLTGAFQFGSIDRLDDSPNYAHVIPDADIVPETLEFTFPCSGCPEGFRKIPVGLGQTALSLVETALAHRDIHFTSEEAARPGTDLERAIPQQTITNPSFTSVA